MAYTRTNLLKRISEIQEFARQYYEPGRQDRSWMWVWKHRVNPKYHLTYKTFLKYMAVDIEKELQECSDDFQDESSRFKQLTLFEE